MFRWRAFLLFALFFSALCADKVALKNSITMDAPWLTGPLLTPTGLTIPPGHLNVEAYLYATFETGFYNRHWDPRPQKTFVETTCQLWVEAGVTSWMDIELIPSFSYNHCDHSGHLVWNDLTLIADFQLYPGSFPPNSSLSPAIKFTLGEIFPTGKYQNLAEGKHLTDQGGLGSFQTLIALTLGQLFYISPHHFFNLRYCLQYTIPSPVHVRGLNSYGGSSGTDGTVYPGQALLTEIGIEYTLTQKWVLACDFSATWTKRIKFQGETGGAPVGWGSAAQFSLAPAIEYNWSSRLGIICGCWFTVAGRNSTQFYSSATALNYYY